jgi:hypothetical protein
LLWWRQGAPSGDDRRKNLLPSEYLLMQNQKIPPYLGSRRWDWRDDSEKLGSFRGGSLMKLFVRKHTKKIKATLG